MRVLSAVAVLLFSSAAFAADMPMYAPQQQVQVQMSAANQLAPAYAPQPYQAYPYYAQPQQVAPQVQAPQVQADTHTDRKTDIMWMNSF